ncbi:MAG: metal ABC transporter permease [Proteobacteria bacterium]|nr:metal ABC transporter permease [Pseudomonadota bacterium]
MTFDLTLLSIIAPAFVVSLLVVVTHVPLGLEVLKRGIIFIDLATAQIAGLGAVAATLYVGEVHSFEDLIIVNLFAFSAALLAGLFFSWIEKRLRKYQEALIGGAFVLAASMALLVLANQPLGNEEFRDLLAGQILFVSWLQIGLIALIYLPIMAIWFRFREKFQHLGFYMIFAIVVTASVQVVGVYLVFATLIFPALAAWGLPEKRRLAAAYGVAGVGLLAGLITSLLTDYPTGPTLVWSLALAALLGALWFYRRARAA